ncbi:exonuclease [Cooperia oncophora]
MNAVLSRSSSLISSFGLNRCPQSFIATTSSCYKVPFQKKKPPFLKKRESSSVQAVSSKVLSVASMSSAQHGAPKLSQEFDYLLVLDFEATCCEDGKILPFQEIIEFPVAKLDTRTWEVNAYFHQYVRPTVNPDLTSFCTHLTGIIQAMVENQPTIDQVLNDFDDWLKKEGVLDSRFAFVTCGDWDLGVMLPSESANKHLSLPSYFDKWINVKKSYCEHSGTFAKGLRDLLRIYNLQHAGRLHSGIDDVKTICALTSAIANEGYVFRINGSRTDDLERKRIFKNVSV